MDSTAIQEIQAAAAAIEAQRVVSARVDHSAVLVPPGYKLASLEAYSATRDHFAGCYTTFNQDNYVNYCSENKAERIFVDGDQFRAVAFFDLGDHDEPGHAKHRAALTLKKTAAFTALERFADREMTQQDAAETVEDWGQYLQAFDEHDQDIGKAKTLMAIRDVKINATSLEQHKKENLSEGRSLLESIEASSEHRLPSWLTFTCHPYLHMSERSFMLRVSVITREGKLFFKFRLADMEKSKEEMAEEFADSLVADLEGPTDPAAPVPDKYPDIYIGEFLTE